MTLAGKELAGLRRDGAGVDMIPLILSQIFAVALVRQGFWGRQQYLLATRSLGEKIVIASITHEC